MPRPQNNIPKPIEDRVWHYMVHKDELRARFDANHVFAGYPRHLMYAIARPGVPVLFK
jgi:hypothetical protein